jgi:hypothetical protein
LDFEVAVVGGGGEEEADILITVEKRRPERNLLGFESFGEENLEIQPLKINVADVKGRR